MTDLRVLGPSSPALAAMRFVLSPAPVRARTRVDARLPRRRRPRHQCGAAYSLAQAAAHRKDRRRSLYSGSRRREPCPWPRLGAHRLAVAAVAAPLAHHQAPRRRAARPPRGSFATTLPVLLELSLNRHAKSSSLTSLGNVDEDLLFSEDVSTRETGRRGCSGRPRCGRSASGLEGRPARVLPKPAVPL